MSTIYSTACFLTTFKNISGATAFFGFLPPHGVTLTNNEELSVFGATAEIICRGDRLANQRSMDSFLAAAGNSIQVTQTPALILTDTVTTAVKQVNAASGVLGLYNPCYDTSIGHT